MGSYDHKQTDTLDVVDVRMMYYKILLVKHILNKEILNVIRFAPQVRRDESTKFQF